MRVNWRICRSSKRETVVIDDVEQHSEPEQKPLQDNNNENVQAAGGRQAYPLRKKLLNRCSSTLVTFLLIGMVAGITIVYFTISPNVTPGKDTGCNCTGFSKDQGPTNIPAPSPPPPNPTSPPQKPPIYISVIDANEAGLGVS